MGREIRMVPPNWQHPKDHNRNYIPLYNQSYKEKAEEWIKGFNEFKSTQYCKYYWEFDSAPLDSDDYVPYSKEEATWYQVYETVSEGTPVTPAFETQQELIDHLVKFGESLNPYCTDKITQQAAESFVLEKHYAPSMTCTISTAGLIILHGIQTCEDL